MHQALFVSEILVEIFSHLDPTPSSTPSPPRKSLAALARTCKVFHDPAMDVLWAYIEGIEPLLGCVRRLHPLIYGSGPKWFGCPWCEGVEPLSAYDARQFLRHAARVRSLFINFEPSHHYHFHLLSESVFPIETTVFPRLLSLSWMVLPQDSRHLHLFLSPTLRRCELRTIDPNLEYITTRCAVLERLSFESSYSLATASDISLLSDTIRSCNRLVELCCPLLDSEGFRCLANLPTLVRLDINGPGVDDLLDRDVLTLAPFLNLTALSIVLGKPFSVEVENIIMVIRHSKFPSLKKFKLFTDDILWEEAEQLFISLSQCGASQTLEHVNIYLRDSEARRNPFLVITHFLRFTQLRYLRLDIGIPIYLDNNLLLEAMSSWPRIESLELLDQEEISGVTFHGLFAALLLCPRLHTLQVSMDAANIDIDPKAELFQHPSLQKLHLCSSPVTDAETVAFIIFSRLPRVSEVEYDEYFDASLPVWRQVSRHHRSLKQNAIQGLTV